MSLKLGDTISIMNVLGNSTRKDKGQKLCDLFTEESWYIDAYQKMTTSILLMRSKQICCKMGAEAVHDLLQRIDLDQLSFDLRNAAST